MRERAAPDYDQKRKAAHRRPPFHFAISVRSAHGVIACRPGLWEQRVVALLFRDREADIRSIVARPELVTAGRKVAWKYRIRSASVQPDEPAQVTESLSGKVQPVRALLKEQIHAAVISARVSQRRKWRRRVHAWRSSALRTLIERDVRAEAVQLREKGRDITLVQCHFRLNQARLNTASKHH